MLFWKRLGSYLSFKTKNKQDTLQFTLPLIIDGEIQSSHLQMIEHTDEWLIEKLKT